MEQRKLLMVVAGVAFLIMWFVNTRQVYTTEHMSGAVILKDADKREVDGYLRTPEAERSKVLSKLSPAAKHLVQFLEANPVSTIDDAFVNKILELSHVPKENREPDNMKAYQRKELTRHVIIPLIYAYADTYEKLEKEPSSMEFRQQMLKVANNTPQVKNLMETMRIITSDRYEQDIQAELKKTNDNSWEKHRFRTALGEIHAAKLFAGEVTYPFPGSTSPIIEEILEIVRKYYFGSSMPQASVAGLQKTLVGIFGGLGGMIVIAVIVYFVFFR